MACSMAVSTDPAEAADFRARNGGTVTLTLRAEAGVTAKLLSVQYANQPMDNIDPLQFVVSPGCQPLFITYSASQPGAMLQLLEVCGPRSSRRCAPSSSIPALRVRASSSSE